MSSARPTILHPCGYAWDGDVLVVHFRCSDGATRSIHWPAEALIMTWFDADNANSERLRPDLH
jgi:hypothetical protein